jgi:hypothetical protein
MYHKINKYSQQIVIVGPIAAVTVAKYRPQYELNLATPIAVDPPSSNVINIRKIFFREKDGLVWFDTD